MEVQSRRRNAKHFVLPLVTRKVLYTHSFTVARRSQRTSATAVHCFNAKRAKKMLVVATCVKVKEPLTMR